MMAGTNNIIGTIGELRSWAHTYADLGLQIFPVNPTNKTPLVSQYDATVDHDQLDSWWTRHPSALIGHRLPEHLVILDIDPRHNGLATWAALREAVGGWPVTRVHNSGRGDKGGHVWFLRPDDNLTSHRLDEWARQHGTGHAITDSNRWVSGIDILQHNHRYTILPPSPHPDTAKPYFWQDGRGIDTPAAPMPALLADLITDTPTPAAPARPPRTPDSDSIIDWYKQHHTITELLTGAGWTLRAGEGDSDGSRWRHPTATSAFSATVTGDCIYVYSPNTPFIPTAPGDPRGYDSFDIYTTLQHAGDKSRASSAARELKDGPSIRLDDFNLAPATKAAAAADDPRIPVAGETPADTELTGWEATDLAVVLDASYTPPVPTIGTRNDGAGLFYRERINSILGESGGGKSWVAQYVCAQQLVAGADCVYIDFEDHAPSLVGRLRALGVPDQQIHRHFTYIQPQRAYTPEAAQLLEAAVVACDPTIVVIDSVGEAMAVQGAKQNDDDEVARWYRMLARRIASYGPAVVLIDHVPKSREASPLFAIGSQRKRAAIDGAAYRAEQVKPLGKGHAGIVKLITAKDRNGHYPINTVAADFHMRADDNGLQVDAFLAPHVTGADRPTVVMEKISRLLEGRPAKATQAVKDEVEAKTEYVVTALRLLVDEGFVSSYTQGRGTFYASERVYRQDADTLGLTGDA